MRRHVMGDWAALRRRTSRGLSWQRIGGWCLCQALYGFVETCNLVVSVSSAGRCSPRISDVSEQSRRQAQGSTCP